MKYLLLLFTLLLNNTNQAVVASPTHDSIYAAGVSFGSMCCGTSSDQFLKDYVKKFNKKYKVKITADKFGGCGREGEFVVLFPLTKIKKTTSQQFINGLEKLLPAQDAKNKKIKSSSGGFQLLRNVKAAECNHCRMGKTKWS